MEGNKQRGEVTIHVKGKPYVLRPSLNALCVIEDKGVYKSSTELFMKANLGEMRAVRALVWSYLQARHAEEFTTEQDAGNFIDEAGLDTINTALGEVMEVNQPEPGSVIAEELKKDGNEDPKSAQAGSGVGS